SSTPGSSTAVVIGDSITIDSRMLGETRRINIYKPAMYDKDSSRYPVLYMSDGGAEEDFHHITGIVQVSVMNGTMRPFLVVGIENTVRRRDLTGPTENPEDLVRTATPKVGGSALFRRFIREELMPEIRKHYRTTAETAIVGESLGGLFALETFFLDPDLFDTYVSVSPSLWWNNQSIARNAAARLKKYGNRKKTLFIAKERDEDSGDGAKILADALREVAPPGLTWHYAPMPEEGHGTIFHGAALKAFRTVFAPPPEPTPAAGTSPTGVGTH
ncbi:MAG: alpha/beta hydrolase-fold protein, partial [Byssovorax sp.]